MTSEVAGGWRRAPDPRDDWTYARYVEMLAAIVRDRPVRPIRPPLSTGQVIARWAFWRHDVEWHLAPAVRMAEIERQLGVRAVYFVSLTSTYNPLDEAGELAVRAILRAGHELGLHYDPWHLQQYGEKRAYSRLAADVTLLEDTFDVKVTFLSAHRPTRAAPMDAPAGCVEVYDLPGTYLSDSSQAWRTMPPDLVLAQYERLHVNTHPDMWSASGGPIEGELAREAREAYNRTCEQLRAMLQMRSVGSLVRAAHDARFTKKGEHG
jgi:hypothetical protein